MTDRTIIRVTDTGPESGAFNMAVDEYLLDHTTGTWLRFYQWRPACISTGRFQKIRNTGLERAAELGIGLVRRMTGGKAVFHADDLSYSFITDADRLPGKVGLSYPAITAAICDAMTALGLPAALSITTGIATGDSLLCAETHAPGDVLIRGKKVCGSAQARHGGRVLQHGSITISQAGFDLEKKLMLFCSSDRPAKTHPSVEETRDTENTPEIAHQPDTSRSTSVEAEYGGSVPLARLKELIAEQLASRFHACVETDETDFSGCGPIALSSLPKFSGSEWTLRF